MQAIPLGGGGGQLLLLCTHTLNHLPFAEPPALVGLSRQWWPLELLLVQPRGAFLPKQMWWQSCDPCLEKVFGVFMEEQYCALQNKVISTTELPKIIFLFIWHSAGNHCWAALSHYCHQQCLQLPFQRHILKHPTPAQSHNTARCI